LRVTGGTYKGRNLVCPPGVIRPAMDRMRESLLAILGDIRGRSFLDLYCGSGSVGIEAASRGAEPVVFVEKDRGKRPALERNLDFVLERTELHILPVEHFLRREKRSFELIFLDPPFRQPGKADVLRQITRKGLLAGGGTLVMHLSKEEEKGFPVFFAEGLASSGRRDDAAQRGDAGDEAGGGGAELHLADRRLYGGSLLLFFR
jgi:16S rRNA (guanine966-N2)-methyltransferase